MIDTVIEEVLVAQADLQVALGFYRLQDVDDTFIEDHLDRSLARLHMLLARLGRPMAMASTHPEVPEFCQEHELSIGPLNDDKYLCRKCGVERERCGAQDWAHDDGDKLLIYGTCLLEKDHESRYHCENRDGKLWASWSGPIQQAPKS